MNPIETIIYVALGFAPTLVALEMSWRMGRNVIGKRGEFKPTRTTAAIIR